MSSQKVHKIIPNQSNQVSFYYRCIAPKRVTGLGDPPLSQFAWATQLLAKKYLSGGEPLATSCPIIQARDWNSGLTFQRQTGYRPTVRSVDQISGRSNRTHVANGSPPLQCFFKKVVVSWRNDAEMGHANSLHASE